MVVLQSRRLVGGALGIIAVTSVFLGASKAGASAGPALPSEAKHAQHVLLISVDGLHQADLVNCIHDGLCPNLADLASGGTTYANASTSRPSDSSPGLMAMVTGASPKLTGVYYDDAYDRTVYAPATSSSIARATRSKST